MSFNPLDGRVAASVTINVPDLLACAFRIQAMRTCRLLEDNGPVAFLDYVLSRQPSADGPDQLRLRAIPNDRRFDLLLLRPFDQIPFNDDFLGVVTDTTGKLEITDDGKTEEYLRIGGRIETIHGRVTLEQADEANPHAAPVAQEHDLDYWDYMRQITDRAGQSLALTLFVELDRGQPRFELWQGMPLSPQRVFVS